MSISDIERAINNAKDQRYKQLTRQELVRSLVHPFDRFDVNASKFVHNDGREKVLVKLEGILPVEYRGIQYNIPIMLWLSDDFPYESPICFVRPVQNMILSERCAVIDRNGRITNLTTLHHWNHDKTSLTDVFRDMAIQFGQSPPVFAKSVDSPITPSNECEQSHIGFGRSLVDSSCAALARQPSSQIMGGKLPQTIPDHVLRNSLFTAVLDKAKRKFVSHLHEQKAEISILKKTEADLLAGGQRIRDILKSLSTEEQRLNGYILTVKENYNEMEEAIATMKKQQANKEDGANSMINVVTKLFVPSTQLFAQIVRLYTEDGSIQDALFYMGEGQRKHTISLADYLRFVRELARKQFFLRATMLKARRIVGV